MLSEKGKLKMFFGHFGILIITLVSFSWSQLVTEDLLSNAGFDLEDNLGMPVDWTPKNPERVGFTAIVDKEDKMVGEGALRVAVTAEITDRDIHVTQGLQTFPFGEERLYFRGWVKYKNVSGNNFHIVVHEAKSNPSPPYWEEISGGWQRAYYGGGTEDEWIQVEGDVPIRADANTAVFRIWVGKGQMPGCTVWVDEMELSTAPLPPPGEDPPPTAVSNISAKERAAMLSVNGNRVQFNRPVNYQLNVFSPNGKRSLHLSGYGKMVDLTNAHLPGGYYIIKVNSDIGDAVQPMILSK